MGYFANGTEADRFEAEYCSRCVHGQDRDKDCPVMQAHFLYGYEECNNVGKTNAANILEMLIPRDGPWNGECAMFVPVKL
jgi:hypothetical protein